MSKYPEKNGSRLVHAQPVQHPDLRRTEAHPGFSGGLEGELREYLGILRRRVGLIRTVFLSVLVLTVAYSLLKSPVYRASALVEVRGGGEQIPSIEGLFDRRDPSEEVLRTHFGLLRSTTLAGHVIDDLALDTLDEFNEDGDAERQELVAGFLERLVVDPVEESRLVRVSFDAGSAELSARVANSVVRSYGDIRSRTAHEAARRLALQLDSVEVQIRASETRLREYARAQELPYLVEQDLMAQSGAELSELRGRLTESQRARYDRESRYDIVVGEGRVNIVDDPLIAELEVRLSELRREHARLSATFTDAYPETADLRRQIDQVRSLIREEHLRVAAEVESEYQLALQQEAKLEQAIEEAERKAAELGTESGAYHVLRQAVLANRRLFGDLTERRREAEIAASVGSSDLMLVDAATPPPEPHRPVFAMNLGLGVMLGVVLGVGAAFMREMTDGTVRTAEDVTDGDDVPVLALIPAMDDPRLATEHRADPLPPANGSSRGSGHHQPPWHRVDLQEPWSPTSSMIADAFGALRASVLLRDHGPTPRSLLVSSCRAGEGKTTVSVNLAMSLAKLGNRVVLVDSDLRRPAIHAALGLSAEPGLVQCLTTGTPWAENLHEAVVPGLDVLTSGGASARAGELIAGERLAPLLGSLESAYDFVVVDAPALFINASDARFLAAMVDGTVVVVRSGSTPRALVRRIPGSTPNLLGVVVNDLRKTSLPEYFGDYFADYGAAPGARDTNPRPGRGSPTEAALERVQRWIHTDERVGS